MVTERDREIVELLDRSGGLEVVSLRVMLGLSHAVAYRRLARLGEYGMVRPEAPFRGSAALFVPTRLGLRDMLGLADAKSPAVSAWSYNHQLHVGRVLAQLHAQGVAWESSRVTRRRRVAAEQAGDLMKSKRLALWLPRTHRTHLPDALIWPSDQSRERDRPIAIEVELAQKSRARLDEILSEYTTSIGFRAVVYVCDPKCHRAVLSAAEADPACWSRRSTSSVAASRCPRGRAVSQSTSRVTARLGSSPGSPPAPSARLRARTRSGLVFRNGARLPAVAALDGCLRPQFACGWNEGERPR